MRIRIQAGADAGKVVEVSDRLTVGRDQAAGLTLADKEASRSHAYLRPLPDGRIEIGDLGSSNGTFVNGQRITGPVALSGGEQIRIGQTTMVAEGAPAPAAAGAVAPPPPTQQQPPFQPQRSQSRIGRMSQSAIQRFKLQRSVRIATILAATAIVLLIAVVVLALTKTGPFAEDPSGEDIVGGIESSTLYVLSATDGTPLGHGTGWVYDPDEGLVVTNAHVVAPPGQLSLEGELTPSLDYAATLGDEEVAADTLRDASLYANAPCSDLAMLQIEDTAGFEELERGSQSELERGETVYAVGFPGNVVTPSLDEQLAATEGIVSVAEESLGQGALASQDPDVRTFPNLVQTDAAINPGNSGGPLVNTDEQLVGVNTLTAIEEMQQGFAIGVDHVEEITSTLAEGNSIASLGFDFVADGQGLLVTSAVKGSQAERQGFGTELAVVESINGEPVGTRTDYCEVMQEVPAGEQVTVQGVVDGGGRFSFPLPVVDEPLATDPLEVQAP